MRETLKLPANVRPRRRIAKRCAIESVADFAARWMHETYPQLFDPRQRVPLAIGIRRDLLKARPQGVSDKGIRIAVYRWCRSADYLKSLAKGGARSGLDGESGNVTADQVMYAKQKLNEQPN